MAAAMRVFLRDTIGLGMDAAGLAKANAIIDEGLDDIDELADIYDNDGIKTLCANVRKPAGNIPDPNWVAPAPNPRRLRAPLIPRPGQPIPTASEQRLNTAAYGAMLYTSINRTVETAILNRARLREFKRHKDMVDNHTEPESLDQISKSFTVMKFLDQFPTYLRELHGVSKVALSYIIRENENPPNPLPALVANRPWGGENTSMMDELIINTPHTGPSFDADNARVFAILSKVLTGTNAMTSITRFQRTRNGRGAYLDLVAHNMGSAKWEKLVELAELVLNTRIWNGKNSRYPLKVHIARHREAYNDLVRASDQITYAPPNETSRVRYLLNSIQCSDATILSAKTAIKADNTKKSSFENAADFLLITAPPPKNNNRPHQISSVRRGKTNKRNGKRQGTGKVQVGPETGVEVRFYTKSEWTKLSQEERDECIKIRKSDTRKRKQNTEGEDESDRKIAALMERLEAQERQISALKSGLPPEPKSKAPLKPPSGFTQRKKKVTIQEDEN